MRATITGMTFPYAPETITRAEADALPGLTVLEFGTDWCSWCQGAQAAITEALQARPGLRHLKVEDGKGRPLGRSYAVKLWPTLVVLQEGREVARIVRPADSASIRQALDTPA
jgi:thioredoxin 1